MEEEFTLMVVLAWFFPTHWLLLFKFVDFGESCRVQKKTTLFLGEINRRRTEWESLDIGTIYCPRTLAHVHLHVLVEDENCKQKQANNFPCACVIIW